MIEVALSIQFSPIQGFHLAYVGEFRQSFLPDLSETSDQPPLEHIVEPMPGSFSFHFMGQAMFPRVWFHDPANTKLVQIQQDRLIWNWRKGNPEDQYPRFEPIFGSLSGAFDQFERFLMAKGLEAPQIDQCELTYVNVISSAAHYAGVQDTPRLFSFVSSTDRGDFLPVAENVTFQLRYVITGEDNVPRGRLYIEGSPIIEVGTGRPAFMLKLVARGAPIGDGFSGASDFLHLGREWIVRGFTDITSKEMHDYWERQ
ncbi:MAG TPA: TIGR04255 family protein [Fimbriimonadaceae bacterium]|nr:TIGR04255 family protein [Fimbriimonadaceae bacterium]